MDSNVYYRQLEIQLRREFSLGEKKVHTEKLHVRTSSGKKY